MSDTILITGGNGVIGSWTCRELVTRGWEVVVLDRLERPVVPFPELEGTTRIVGDITDTGLVATLLDRHAISRALHLAALIGVRAEEDPAAAIEVNALATARLLDVAAEHGLARTIVMSTKGVLGALAPRYLHPVYDPVPVDAPARPSGVYETTKALVEAVVRRHRERGRSVAAVRLATTWGPGKTGETHAGYSLHSDVVLRALRGEGSRLPAGPEQGHDLLYYGDVASGLADALLSPGELRRPVYHLGSGRVVTLGEFGRAVQAAFPGVAIEFGEGTSPGRNCRLDIEPAREDLRYAPTWDLARALADPRWADAGRRC